MQERITASTAIRAAISKMWVLIQRVKIFASLRVSASVQALLHQKQFIFLDPSALAGDVVVHVMTSSEDLLEALRSAPSSWQGCDWDTEFGLRRANLRGLSSRQARLAAEATRGKESEFWREAFRYLDGVERDARTAASLASEAIVLWQLGSHAEALTRLDGAITLEGKYRTPVCYAPLRRLLQEKISAAREDSGGWQEDCHAG